MEVSQEAINKLENVYFRHFEYDYSSCPVDRRNGQYCDGIEAAVSILLGDAVFEQMYERFNERRKLALKKGELMPYQGKYRDRRPKLLREDLR